MNEGIIGVIIGMFGALIINYFDRRSRFLLSIAKERFRASQEAYIFSKYVGTRVTDHDEHKIERIAKTREWFDRNNLYLSPSIRDAIETTLHKVDWYNTQREYQRELMAAGDKDEAAKISKQIGDDFLYIKSLPRLIQNSMDVYYNMDLGPLGKLKSLQWLGSKWIKKA